MKTTKLSSRPSKQQKFEPKEIHTLGQGITKRLLEKYKPRNHWDKVGIKSINKLKRVA